MLEDRQMKEGEKRKRKERRGDEIHFKGITEKEGERDGGRTERI